jgi:hypothetical protein
MDNPLPYIVPHNKSLAIRAGWCKQNYKASNHWTPELMIFKQVQGTRIRVCAFLQGWIASNVVSFGWHFKSLAKNKENLIGFTHHIIGQSARVKREPGSQSKKQIILVGIIQKITHKLGSQCKQRLIILHYKPSYLSLLISNIPNHHSFIIVYITLFQEIIHDIL